MSLPWCGKVPWIPACFSKHLFSPIRSGLAWFFPFSECLDSLLQLGLSNDNLSFFNPHNLANEITVRRTCYPLKPSWDFSGHFRIERLVEHRTLLPRPPPSSIPPASRLRRFPSSSSSSSLLPPPAGRSYTAQSPRLDHPLPTPHSRLRPPAAHRPLLHPPSLSPSSSSPPAVPTPYRCCAAIHFLSYIQTFFLLFTLSGNRCNVSNSLFLVLVEVSLLQAQQPCPQEALKAAVVAVAN